MQEWEDMFSYTTMDISGILSYIIYSLKMSGIKEKWEIPSKYLQQKSLS